MKFKKYKNWILRNKYILIVLGIFLCELLLRFYQLEEKSVFGWDQVDNAWAAKNIIIDHKFPLVGMVAKGNSGIYIGPLYYYLISLIYWIMDLNPVASSIMAGLTSIFSFWVIYFVSKKLFSQKVAIVAVFLNTFMLPAIFFDRAQWPVALIPPISLLIFYVLYKIAMGDAKKIIYLALLVGFSVSIHFTSIFYPIFIILALPFFPWNKKTLFYILISLPLFLLFLVPNIIYQLQQKSVSSFSNYFDAYFIGFHMRRVMWIMGDGLIQFNAYLYLDKFYSLKFILLPVFFLIYLYRSIRREKLIFCYFILIWFIVPWFVFATYGGEISDYYFSINRFIALMVISYILIRIWDIKTAIPKIIVAGVLFYIAITNVFQYLPYTNSGLKDRKRYVLDKIYKGEKIDFQEGVPESYLYYYYIHKKK